jgi:acetyltransferase
MDKAAPPVFVGIDVSKHRLDIHLRPSGEGSTIDHDDENVAALVERLVALDARVRVAPPGRRADERLAIRPYPNELEEEVALADGRRLRLRPIRPEDEPALVAAFRQLSPEAVRLRFFAPLKELTHQAAARLTQIDYDREMAFLLLDGKELLGVGRLAADPGFEQAEFALVVASDRQGHGYGTLLLDHVLRYAKARGVKRVVGHVLRENHKMLELTKRLGFKREGGRSGEPDIRVVKPTASL